MTIQDGDEKKKRVQSVERGTSDDLEILKQIVSENIQIKVKVLEFLRNHRKTQDKTIFDVAEEKGKKKKEKKK